MTPGGTVSIASRTISSSKEEHTASGAGTSISRLLGLLVATLAEIISAGVDDESALCMALVRCLIPQWRSKRTPMTLSEPISLMSLSWMLP